MSAGPKLRAALIAHDQKKDDMAAFVAAHAERLGACEIWATGTTGARIQERCPQLAVTRLKSGPSAATSRSAPRSPKAASTC